jgi:hypothetical protein
MTEHRGGAIAVTSPCTCVFPDRPQPFKGAALVSADQS